MAKDKKNKKRSVMVLVQGCNEVFVVPKCRIKEFKKEWFTSESERDIILYDFEEIEYVVEISAKTFVDVHRKL